MPSLRTFSIKFDRPSAAYQVGESVTGNIIVDTIKDKSIRGIYIVARGSALVQWAKTPIDDNREKSVSYVAGEHYFTIMSYVLGSSTSESTIELKAGFHQYPFQFQLPSNIPTSFEDPHGYVRYTVKAMIERPWKFDHECKVAFTVVSIFDLNMHRDKCLGIHEEVQKNFSCCCFNQGSMNISIRVPSSGYVPGQRINALMNYRNAPTEISIMKIGLKLERVLMFHATTNRKIDRSEITSTMYEGPFMAQGVTNLEIMVPPIPPSHVPFCKIMDLDYYLKVAVHFTGSRITSSNIYDFSHTVEVWYLLSNDLPLQVVGIVQIPATSLGIEKHLKIVRRYPLLIGSIPLYCAPNVADIQQINIAPYSTKEPATSNGTPVPEVPQPGTSTANKQRSHLRLVIPDPANPAVGWTIPPPSYEECMLGAQNIRDDDESTHVQGADAPFRPKYPVFNYPAPSVPHN